MDVKIDYIVSELKVKQKNITIKTGCLLFIDQLTGARSTQKLVEIHNRCWLGINQKIVFRTIFYV